MSEVVVKREVKSEVFLMDCMEGMKSIATGSIDLLVTDPPYAMTNNAWDTSIDLPSLWIEWERVVKEDGAMVFTSAQPFTTELINSNLKNFRYDLIWEKSIATGFLNANRMPLRGHEVVCVFYRKLPVYNPQKYKLEGRPSFKKGNKARGSKNYGAFTHEMDIGSKDGSRFPRSVFTVDYENSFFDSSFDSVQKTVHPTQKPVALFKYLIQTFSNKGDAVLDCYMGSGSSRLAAYDADRSYTGYEIDPDYFNAQEKRFNQYKSQLRLEI
jgi:site-specific DNA-methyltransferase (adenine-specific)